MTLRSFLPALALLAACGSEPTSSTSTTTAAICTRADIDGACSAPSSAEFIDGEFWTVTLRTTVTDRVEYADGGVLCVLTETRCITEECNLFGGNIASAGEAIAACREIYGR